MKSIALCRVSTPEQKTEGHSLERQEESVIKTAKELDAPIIKTWSLDQSSRVGKNLNRKDLKEMQDFCKQNKHVKYLIVDEPDRFMRDIKYFYYFEAVFEQLGVKVWYASKPELNSDDIMAKFSKIFQVFKAEASNDERMSKSLGGLKGRVAAGYSPFPLHQGYKRGLTPGLHEPEEPRFSMLQVAFREVLLRQFTVSESLERLTKKGYTTPSGKELRIDRYRSMLKDPYYAGIVWIKTWDESLRNNKALHKAMISPDDWEELTAIVDDKKRKFLRKTHNPKYPMSNQIYCGVCKDKKLVGYDHRNGKGWVGREYRCRGCGKKYKKEAVHDGVDKALEPARLFPEARDDFIAALRRVWEGDQKEILNHIELLKQRLDGLVIEKSKLIRSMATNPSLEDDLKLAVEEVKGEIKRTESEIKENDNLEDDFIDFVNFSLGYIDDQKSQWWDLQHNERVKCKQLVFKQEIFIDYDGKVYTPEFSPILSLIGTKKEAFRASDSHMVVCSRSSSNYF